MTALATMPARSLPPGITVAGQRIDFGWGEPHELGSTAFWIHLAREAELPESLRIGDTLAEEVAACLLGGFGMPADIGWAAFDALKDEGLLARGRRPSASEIETVLSIPLTIPGRPRPTRYRFPKQRGIRLSQALEMVEAQSYWPDDPRELRDALCLLPGVGPKTASWITRNMTQSDDIAVLDIHIHRVGIAAGFFPAAWKLPRDYKLFEDAFCQVAAIGEVSAALLDAVIWRTMHDLGQGARMLVGGAA